MHIANKHQRVRAQSDAHDGHSAVILRSYVRVVTSLMAAVAWMACGQSHRSPAPVRALHADVRVVSFRHDIYPVLAKHCAESAGCHGDEPTHSVDLDLREPAAYSELVGAAAEARPSSLRITPLDPTASFLIDKLVGSLHAGEGKQMPLDEQTGEPLVPSPLPPEFIHDVLKPWISAGAPNN